MPTNLFNSVKMFKPKSSRFDLTHDVKLSLNMGELVPIMCTECVPGDRFNISAESLIRFAPMVAPVMHRFDVTMHYFFVPNRIIWDDWENFIMAKTPVPAAPFFSFTGDTADVRPLANYLGIPMMGFAGTAQHISALPFVAYQKIYNEYYRDQNMIAEVTSFALNGDNNVNANDLLTLRKRAWEHDYFTSALPFAQAGAEVDIPLGDITLKDDWNSVHGAEPRFKVNDLSSAPAGDIEQNAGIFATPSIDKLAYDPDGSLATESTTINDLRRAFRLQEWLEKNARGGRRYIESILSHFGVRSSDKRLQRPEYIIGVKTPVMISEVLNSGSTAAPIGNMSGHGVAAVQGRSGFYFCEEHGYIMGIMSVMPKTAYQQGIPKHFLKDDPFDFYWPSFANIGEQEVLNKELYAFTGTGDNVFGYVPRYAEYKFENNRVAGEFATSLNYWHAGRIFATQPALNEAFISADPTHRIFAVTTTTVDKLYAHVLNKIIAIRPMPKFGNPSF